VGCSRDDGPLWTSLSVISVFPVVSGCFPEVTFRIAVPVKCDGENV